MDKTNLSPTFRELVEIIEALRDCITDINEVYNDAAKEVNEAWKMKP